LTLDYDRRKIDYQKSFPTNQINGFQDSYQAACKFTELDIDGQAHSRSNIKRFFELLLLEFWRKEFFFASSFTDGKINRMLKSFVLW